EHAIEVVDRKAAGAQQARLGLGDGVIHGIGQVAGFVFTLWGSGRARTRPGRDRAGRAARHGSPSPPGTARESGAGPLAGARGCSFAISSITGSSHVPPTW